MTKRYDALIAQIHPEWHALVGEALNAVDSAYLQALLTTNDWLPGQDALLAAFRLPLSKTRYILLGESPYPRPESANGYAFWDASVGSLWSKTGFSREINRATSLRNLMKMLLYARGDLGEDKSQQAIARLDQAGFHQTAAQLFTYLLEQGFLLLNASLVYQVGKIPYHARMWRPFVCTLLNQLAAQKPQIQLILFGKIAALIPERVHFNCLISEHPYNLSFITNPQVVNFFNPLDLLVDHGKKHKY